MKENKKEYNYIHLECYNHIDFCDTEQFIRDCKIEANQLGVSLMEWLKAFEILERQRTNALYIDKHKLYKKGLFAEK